MIYEAIVKEGMDLNWTKQQVAAEFTRAADEFYKSKQLDTKHRNIDATPPYPILDWGL